MPLKLRVLITLDNMAVLDEVASFFKSPISTILASADTLHPFFGGIGCLLVFSQK